MKKVTRLCILLMVAVVMVFAGFLTACHQSMNPDLELDVSNSAFDTPFASRAILTDMAQIPGSVDWRIARFYALRTMEHFRETNSWGNAVLSQYPLIIHCNVTGRPRFLEFRVISNNKEIGAIVSVASEDEGKAIQWVLSYAIPITANIAREIRTNQGQLIDAGYPGNLLFRRTGARQPIYASTEEKVTRDYFTVTPAIDFLLSINPDEYELYGIPSREALAVMIAYQRANNERIQIFWQEVNAIRGEILHMNDEEIIHAARSEMNTFYSITPSPNAFILPSWRIRAAWARPVQPHDTCGAYCLYFITLGLQNGGGFPGGVPATQNLARQQQIFYIYVNSLGGSGPRFLSTLANHFAHFTNYRITHWFILSHNFSNINNHIRNVGLPVISRRTGKGHENKGWHYRVIIGTDIVPGQNFYVMHDNGADHHTGIRIYRECATNRAQLDVGMVNR